MDNKIGLEEHFAIPETMSDSLGFAGASLMTDLGPRLTDLHNQRLGLMDRYGIEIMILSLNAPAIQRIGDTQHAIEIARRANDHLAGEIAKRPDRFRGFAALPMQNAEAAAAELRRCVREFGFVGAMVNGYSEIGGRYNCVYYDGKSYWPFWREVEALGVPFYLHPREPSQLKPYEGHPWLTGPAYGFAAETGLHALRLMGCGLFDAYPQLTIVIGHMGEGLTFNLNRIDQRIAWSPAGYPAKRKISEYFAQNFYLTTSGHFRDQALINAILEVGADHILFSTDYPFEDVGEAATWFDRASISEADRRKIGRDNAKSLFKL